MEMIKLTGLWKKKDKNGNTYLSGSLNAATQIAVMANSLKRKENDPDYILYIGTRKPLSESVNHKKRLKRNAID